MALSKTQTKRLGGILTIMFGDDIPSDLLTSLITDGYIVVNGNSYNLTAKGKDEKNRLCTLAGLNIMYSSEKKSST
jgi:hypothetical protein